MIRHALIEWRTVTDKLLTVSKNANEETRDETIAQIESLLDIREKLQLKIVAPFTNEEEAFGMKLVELEAGVQVNLALFAKRIRIDISDSQTKKVHMKSYVNPYSNVARDGAYYDTKQ